MKYIGSIIRDLDLTTKEYITNNFEVKFTKNTAFNKNFSTTATDIKMNGSQSLGELTTLARADHVHPVDTSRAASSHTHSTYDNSTALTGANVYSNISVTDGIVTGLTTRALTAANIGAAPTSHSHGNIASGGTITATAITPADTDYLLISDTSASGKIARGIAIGTGTSTYLRNDGTWVTPPAGKKYCKFVIGTSTSGHTLNDVDYLCDGTADQTEINAAIAALPATGGEIVILDGTYNITAKINLNKSNVTISGNGNSTILKRMYISGDGVITLTSVNYCKIKDLQIDGSKEFFPSANNAIGIQLIGSSTNTVTGNVCDNNAMGILLNSSSANIVTGNTCNNNGDIGIFLFSSSNDNTVTGNTCNNNNTIGILLDSSGNNNITGNTCYNNNMYGIYSVSSSNNTITGNTCNNMYGIYLNSSSNNTVTGNTCNNSTYGIYLDSSNDNAITGNTCNNTNYGIYLISSSNNTITGNTCNNANYGIYLDSSNTNTVTGNTCIRGTGIPLDYSPFEYTIKLSSTNNNYNLIATNNCKGKAVSVDGGTGNSVYGNKWEENIDVVIKTELLTGTVGTGWSGASAPYTIAVTVTGVLASGADYIVDLAMDATSAQRAAWNAGSIKATAQGANTITLTADGIKPMITLPIQVKRI